MVASARAFVLIGKYLKHGKPQSAEREVARYRCHRACLGEKNSHHVNFPTILRNLFLLLEYFVDDFQVAEYVLIARNFIGDNKNKTSFSLVE